MVSLDRGRRATISILIVMNLFTKSRIKENENLVLKMMISSIELVIIYI